MKQVRHPTREGVLFVVLYFTGMHPWSYDRLRVTDIEWQKDPRKFRISWVRPKTHKHLWEDVPQEVGQYIIENLPPARYSRSTYNRWLKLMGNRAGFSKQSISCDTLRHTKAIILTLPKDRGGSNMSIAEASEIVGCSQDVLRDHYQRVRRDEINPTNYDTETSAWKEVFG